MRPRDSQSGFCKPVIGSVTAVLCAIVILTLGPSLAMAQQAQSQPMTSATPTGNEAPKISGDQLDSLVAPVALYPDPLLGQTLAASTYPLEVIQLQQWMERNKNLKDKALADAVTKQNWDPSVQAMAAFPDVVQRLAGNIQWTTDLGNAFLAQQSDVMDAIQRMRAKAQGTGNLKTNAQQKVETQTAEGKQVIVVEQASPQVVYVPSYDPVVVYGEPAYPYPTCVYPWCTPGMGLAWGAGLALGAAWGGGWGWGCGWGHGDINVNWNNKYVNHYNRQNNINRGQGSGNWQHNPQHRGNAPYGDRGTANRFGGTARQQPAGGIANRPGAGAGAGGIGAGRPGGGAGVATRPAGGAGANRPGGGGAGVATRPSGGAGAARPSGGGTGTRPGGGVSTRPAGGGGGGNRVGGHQPSMGGGGGAFGGGSGNFARASSSRGGHSMGGGGFSRGGGGGGGGRRR